MIVSALSELPKLHEIPMSLIKVNSGKIIVELDDENSNRIRLLFTPYQAVRIITADCFDLPEGISVIPRTIMEIKDSYWIQELCNVLKMTDHDANFVDKSRHFLIPLDDDFIEVVAWGINIELV